MSDSQEPSQHAPSSNTRLLTSAELDGSADTNGERTPSVASWSADGSILLAGQAERFSPELLSIISHELRSPLAAIKGYSATLRRHEQRLSRAERKQFLDAIDEASNRLTLIVERILELSQLEMGLATFDREPVALVRLVSEAVAVAERRLATAHEAKRQFTFVVDDRGAATVEGAGLVLADVRYLRDVVDNLIENAIKYSPEGGVVEISLSPGCLAAAPQRPAIQLTIHDTGIGIADEHLARIFETFQRVDIQSTRATEGLGLGLAICREIVERHNGEMHAESTPGAGSSFHVVLPLAEDSKDLLE